MLRRLQQKTWNQSRMAHSIWSRSYVREADGAAVGSAALIRNKYLSVLPEFELTSGETLPEVNVEWEQWGDPTLPAERTVVILPSFSHSSHVAHNRDAPSPGWWENIVGQGKAVDTSLFRVISLSTLGSPYGATSPKSIDPRTGEAYRANFPQITPADMAKCHAQVLDDIGIGRVHAVIGGSMGGLVALEFAAQNPDRMDRLLAMTCTAQTTPGTVAMRRTQRQAILLDPQYQDGNYKPGTILNGMKLARELGMMGYRSREEFDERFDWQPSNDIHFKSSATFDVESYMEYQGKKFARMYDPNCYLLLSKAMDLMNLGHGYSSLAEGISRIQCESMIVGVKQDALIPIQEQRSIVDILQSYGRDSQLVEVDSKFGHDTMFQPQMQLDIFAPIVRHFVEKNMPETLTYEKLRYVDDL